MLNFKSSFIITILSVITDARASLVAKRWNPPLPSCSSYTPYKYAGCFFDQSSPTTALIYRTNLPSGNMTVEICTAFCKGNDYQYAGLEYYGECFCGASVNGPQVNETNCADPCAGDTTEICGGTDYVSVYQDPTFPVENNSTIADYKPMGCYTDLTSTGRTLVWQQDQLNTSTMTVETCLFACKDGGYAFAGVEFGTQCFCGVVLGNGTSQVDSSQCNVPCTGNTSETCGGPALLNLYVASDIESTEPCNGGGPSSSSTTSTPTPTPTPTLCTSTYTITPTPTCEYTCGKWCSKPIPPFTDPKSCQTAVGTRIPIIDRILCVNTNFFQAALDPTNPPYAPGYLASFATCAFIPLIEATRASVTNRVMKNPLLFGISSQLFGRSVVYPAWWANFVSSGSSRRTPAESKGSEIEQFDAEATLFAMLLCIITPTSSLSILKSRSWMTTWFLYPVTGAIIRMVYKKVRRWFGPPEKNCKEAAYYLTMGSYLLGFVYAAALHIGVMTPFLFKPAELKLLLTPCFDISSQGSLAMNVYRTIQWDAIIVFISSLGATLSFARTTREAIKIALLDFAGVALFGSGAALSGVWAWREKRLRNDREDLERREQQENKPKTQ